MSRDKVCSIALSPQEMERWETVVPFTIYNDLEEFVRETMNAMVECLEAEPGIKEVLVICNAIEDGIIDATDSSSLEERDV